MEVGRKFLGLDGWTENGVEHLLFSFSDGTQFGMLADDFDEAVRLRRGVR